MKKFLLKNLNIIGGMFIGLSLPLGPNVLPGNYDILFLPVGVLMIMISYYYTFIDKDKS